MAPILVLDSVVAGYGAGDILKGVNLSVDAGTVTCLIGPNGAGKSTVLKTVSGLLRPKRGTVTFTDQEIEILAEVEHGLFRLALGKPVRVIQSGLGR